MHEGSGRVGSLVEIFGRLEALWGRHLRPTAPGWAGADLTFSQIRLVFLFHEKGPMSMSRLADALGVTLPTASGIVARLARHGLVARRHRDDDRRVVECALTERGQRLLEDMAGARLEMMRRFLSFLTEEEVVQLERVFLSVLMRLEALRPEQSESADRQSADDLPATAAR